MKLTGRLIFWTAVAAVFAVLFVNMFWSLAPDARAVLLTFVVVLVLTAPGIATLAYHAGKGSERRADDDAPAATDDRTEHARDLAVYWQENAEVIRRQMELRAAYEQGRDHAREDASRRCATPGVWLVDQPVSTSIVRR